MNEEHATSLDLRTIEPVLNMGGGWVLDFSDTQFANFFREYGVDIEDPRYQQDGRSKAKRLRAFLRMTSPPTTGRVLSGLLEHRLVAGGEFLDDAVFARFSSIIERLGGRPPKNLRTSAGEDSDATLLDRVFNPDLFRRLPGDPALHDVLVARMREAQQCIANNAWLSAVIVCGSVLEGICLGFGEARPAEANRAYIAQYNRAAPRLWDWKLCEWIDVLMRLGAFSPNVGKFGHSLRDFRNYVHPREQLANNFCPNAHTARIGFQVVLAGVDDLVLFTNPRKP